MTQPAANDFLSRRPWFGAAAAVLLLSGTTSCASSKSSAKSAANPVAPSATAAASGTPKSANATATPPRMQPLQARLTPPRQALAADAGDSRAAVLFAVRVQAALLAGTLRGDVGTQEQLVQEAVGYLGEAARRRPADRATLLAVQGELLLGHGARVEGVSALEASLAAKPNLMALHQLLPLYRQRGDGVKITQVCREARAAMQDADEVYGLLTLCVDNLGKASVREALSWAEPADLEWYEKEVAYRRQKGSPGEPPSPVAEAPASEPVVAGSPASVVPGAAGNLAPQWIQLTLRNDCRHSARLFFGTEFAVGSGTYALLQPGSVKSRRMQVGATISLVEDGQPLASVTIGGASNEVRVDAGCETLTAVSSLP